MRVKSLSKAVHTTPRKAGEVVALVRGRTVDDALTILEHTPRKAAKFVRKTIETAKANAVNNNDLSPSSLKLVEVVVNAGPAQKRYRPAARGRALPFKRRTSHILVTVEGKEVKSKKKPQATATKAKSSKSKSKESK